MKIDSGLGGYQYSGRLYGLERDVEDKKAPENADKPRVASNPAVSSTLLSPSLSDALWDVEGSRLAEEERGTRVLHYPGVSAEVERVQGAYLEFN